MLFGPVAQLGERTVRIRKVVGSNPFRSTRWTLHEHLLFQRRLCRKSVAVMSKQNQRAKVLMCLGPLFYILVPDWDSAPNHNRQTAASNASVNTHSPFLLVGTMSQTPPNAEFILRLRVLQTLFWRVLKRLLIAHLSSFAPSPILGRGCLVCFNKKTHLGRWCGNIPPHPAT